ncbi:MAG TPA: hypothetical protein VNT03_12370 [Baekduia sp.]|nr:hypothetical protein [Baekduia sp.]
MHAITVDAGQAMLEYVLIVGAIATATLLLAVVFWAGAVSALYDALGAALS